MNSTIDPGRKKVPSYGPFADLVGLARHRASNDRDSVGYIYLQDGENPSHRLTYGELDLHARSIAATLQQRCKTGDRVLLLYPPGLEFISAFFGCFYAGCLAVPAYPPRRNRHDSRLESIVRDAVPELVLTTDSIRETCGQAEGVNEALFSIPWVVTDVIDESVAQQWLQHAPDPDSIAFIQYTSGSTSRPKGVCVSHFNLLHTLEDLALGCGYGPESVMVTWLPIHHDLGLIYGVMQPIYRGYPCYLMPPASFLQRPLRWLEAISRFGGTHSAAPNFAFDLCVRAVEKEEAAGLDLSSLSVVLNAAEPIRAESIEKFAAKFASAGFKPKALSGGYGLAETTLKVSMVPAETETPVWRFDSAALERHCVVPSDSANDSTILVGCGRSESDTDYIIVNPETCLQCKPDEVGEIWVSGLTVAQGYFNRDDATKETFKATLADSGEGPFLRTGDLGFIYRDNLFVTGRIKDMIIIRGMNHYPSDIELTVEKACPELRSGCGAAFSIDSSGQERLVVVYELERKYLRTPDVHRDIMLRIREAVVEGHGISVHTVCLLRTNTILKTTSGKIQRQASRNLFLEKKLNVVATLGDTEAGNRLKPEPQPIKELPQADHFRALLLETVAYHLKLKASEIDIHEPLAHYGLDSVAAVAITGEVERFTGRPCNPTILYECPTIATLEDYLLAADSAPMAEKSFNSNRDTVRKRADNSAIAVVGMGCRFPGAESPKEYWKLIASGAIATGEIPSSRWSVDTYYDTEDSPGMMNTRWGGFLKKIDQFDADFFSIAPREADYIDPQQRLLLEVSWEALENSGIRPSSLRGSDSGVFIGISAQDYLQLQIEDTGTISAYTGTGSAHSVAANRISYFLDLRGPSLAIDTACSSSLVAVHQAVMSLRNGECGLALVGGVNALLTPHLTVALSKARMMSPDGCCRVFDAGANGYVRGEGCGVVVLKRLQDALDDNNRILAVIRGSAVRQDGRSNGLTAPNRHAQESVIRAALHDANLSPSAVSLIEAHGTGTALGDPIEVEAIKNVYGERKEGNVCRIGSVKANIGHLESAAGMAGLIKSILSMTEGYMPGNDRLQTLNPLIDLSDTALNISPNPSPWKSNGEPRMSAVSSFGFGGTIAHTIVSEYQAADQKYSDNSFAELCTLSARSLPALKSMAQALAKHIRKAPSPNLGDISFTLNQGREHFEHKLAIVAESPEELHRELDEYTQQDGQVIDSGNGFSGDVVFLFSGQGTQIAGVAEELLRTEPVFRESVEQCDAIINAELKFSASRILERASDSGEPDLPTRIQPVLFSLQYALVRLWQTWGISPTAVIGHSLGEYAAACTAGVMTVEDALKMVIHRAQLSEALPDWGAMAAVFASQSTVEQILPGTGCGIAAINGPEHIAVSGPESGIKTLMGSCKSQGIKSYQLKVTHGFHSPCVEPMLDDVEEYARSLHFKEPQIPVYSTLTGIREAKGIATPVYWRRHLRESVQFQKAVSCLLEDTRKNDAAPVMLEIGPSSTLIGMARRIAGSKKVLWIPSLGSGTNDRRTMLEGLARLHMNGKVIDWNGYYKDRSCRRVALPTYPFQRKRHWLDTHKNHRLIKAVEHPLLGNRLYLAHADGRIVWENTLSVGDVPYLFDHMVNDVVVFPGAAFTEMIAHASRAFGMTECIDIQELEFISPLIFNDSERYCLQTVITPQDDGFACSIFSIADEARSKGDWIHHVQCVVSGAEYSGRVVELADIIDRCTEDVSGKSFYSHWKTRGNYWGPTFQAIQRLKIGGAEAAAWLMETPDAAQESGKYVVHPALLDACVQVMAGGAGDVGAFVGKRAGRLHIAGSLQGELIVTAQWHTENERRMTGDVTVTDEKGRIILMVEDLSFTFLEREQKERWREWLFSEIWEPVTLPVQHAGSPVAEWLVSGDHCTLATGVADQLQEMGHAVYRADVNDDLMPNEKALPINGIILFFPDQENVSHPDDMISAIADCIQLTSQTLAFVSAQSFLRGARVWLVTKNVWAEGKGNPPRPAAGLWGLSSAIAAEYPDNWGGIIDIEEGTDPSDCANHIARAVTGLSRCDKLRIGREVLTPRLHPLNIEAGAGLRNIRPDSAYLITGGFGRLGRGVARWLSEQGARHIILIGRNGPPKEWLADENGAEPGSDPNLRQQLEERGVNVTTAALDISDAKELVRWAKEYRQDGKPPITGIFHAAGVVAKEPVAEISRESCLSALKAKVGGILALEQAFDLGSMESVVLFSSAATLIHSPFLGAYAAANGFLDIYAHQRSQDCPIVSINWSTFRDGGMAAMAEQAGDAAFSRTLQPLHTEDGMQIMGHLLDSPAPRVAVLPVEWEQWQAVYPSQAELTYWDRVVKKGTRQQKEDVTFPDKKSLLELNHEQRQQLLIKVLTQLVSRALGADAAEVASDRPLTALGIDSLMALEIRASLEKAYDVTLPVVIIISGPSISQLAQSLAELLSSQSVSPDGAAAAESRDQDETGFFPLSFNQYSQWLLAGMTPEVSAYHVSFSARVTSLIDVELLQKCLELLVQRHATLRTSYTVYNGEISQQIHETGEVYFENIDSAGLTDEDLLLKAKVAYSHPFDLTSGPMLRAHLFTRNPEDHVLLLVVHHIACDGWSLWLLLEELSELYAAQAHLGDARLPEPGASYLRHTRRQLEKWSDIENLTAGREFWSERLADMPLVLDLATDFPRPLTQSLKGASIPLSLSAELTRSLKEMAVEHNTTVFTILMAAYQVLLYRITGQSRILVGSPTAGRTDTDISRTVGHFVNMIVIRGDLTHKPKWSEFVETMRREIIASFDYQDFPFHLLVEYLQPERSPGRTPIFQVDFTYQRAHTNGELIDFMGGDGGNSCLRWGDLELAPFVVPQQEGQFDISLEIAEGTESLFGFIKYNTDLFRPETISNLSRSFCRILESVCEAPEQRIDEITLVDDHQHRQVNQWAQSAVRDLPDRCLHELFAEQVTETPSALAVVCDNRSLTYQQLDERSDQLASRLRKHGAEAESIVGVCLGRSLELIVSILAVLKTGGAYLPLDPEHPQARRSKMLADSGARLLISDGEPDDLAATDVAIIHPTYVENEKIPAPPELNIRPDNLAYVIYTSGSTGTPKGVMIEHRSVINLINGLQEVIYSRYEGAQQVSLFASTVFDASVQQIFAALCGGHTLHVLTEECRRDSARLLDYWQCEGVTIADATPTLLQMLLDAGLAQRNDLSLKHLIVGGEPLPRELVSRLNTEAGRKIHLTNIYGPTECCVDVTAMDLDIHTLPDLPVIPIGKPMVNTRAFILDDNRAPVVPGMVGELYIGGPNVGRGYLNRETLTAESFITSPFEPNERFYRTGDRARHLPDGTIEFLGRNDNQIKIRGYRIEPGEIEHRLRKCSGVSDAVVVVREDTPGDRRLVAYLVMEEKLGKPGDIRSQLIGDLPDYMIPSFYVAIPAIPLSSSGKVDRGGLPAPAADSLLPRNVSAKPQTDLERELAAIWKSVIGLTEVGIHDNFFDLGGNSLLLTKVQIRLQAALARPVAITDLFRFPTISSLAEFYAADTSAENVNNETADKRLQQKLGVARRRDLRRSQRVSATETEEYQ